LVDEAAFVVVDEAAFVVVEEDLTAAEVVVALQFWRVLVVLDEAAAVVWTTTWLVEGARVVVVVVLLAAAEVLDFEAEEPLPEEEELLPKGEMVTS
jgi:hypothetical protein